MPPFTALSVIRLPGAVPQELSSEQRKEALFSVVRTYEALALKWETDELCNLWGDAHADAMAEECWAIVMNAQVELLRS